MPLYEYSCAACGSRFTMLQPMSAAREGHPCPCCGKVQTHRVMSSFASVGNGGAKGGAAACAPSGSGFQ